MKRWPRSLTCCWRTAWRCTHFCRRVKGCRRSGHMDQWQLFADPRFELCFRYPLTTPQGHAVEKTESQRADAPRIHLVSQESQELYFEVMNLPDLTPQEEYQ